MGFVINYLSMKKSILLLYISEVSGHHSATLAIEGAIKGFNSHPEVLNINGFRYVFPIIEYIVNYIYMKIIKRFPSFWGYLYDNPSIANKISGLKDFINGRKKDKIKDLIESNNCKVVICSQAFPCGIVAEYKKSYPNDIKLIAVVTDFLPHSYWIYDEIDFYIVGSQEAKNTLIKKGVKEEKIKLFGIPIDPKFSKRLDKNTVAQELKITLDRVVILIMGGGRGIGPIKKLISILDRSTINAHLLIVAGANRRLWHWLEKRKFNKSVFIYGFIDYIDKLMEVADILVTKPGGITTAEAISKNLPMLIVNAIPGQEKNNTDFLLSQGAAEKVDNIEEAVKRIEFLLNNRDRLDFIRHRMSVISQPFSSLKISELALGLC